MTYGMLPLSKEWQQMRKENGTVGAVQINDMHCVRCEYSSLSSNTNISLGCNFVFIFGQNMPNLFNIYLTLPLNKREVVWPRF